MNQSFELPDIVLCLVQTGSGGTLHPHDELPGVGHREKGKSQKRRNQKACNKKRRENRERSHGTRYGPGNAAIVHIQGTLEAPVERCVESRTDTLRATCRMRAAR